MVSLIAQYFKFSVAMQTQLGIFLNAPDSTKASCLIFQALHIQNTLVKPSADEAGKCFGSLFLRQGAAVSLTQGIPSSGAHLAGANAPQLSVPREVLRLPAIAWVFLEKRSPSATAFTAEDGQQLNNSPRAPRLPKSPSRASPDRHTGFHTNTSAFWLPPELFCSGGPSYSSNIPRKIKGT